MVDYCPEVEGGDSLQRNTSVGNGLMTGTGYCDATAMGVAAYYSCSGTGVMTLGDSVGLSKGDGQPIMEHHVSAHRILGAQ